MRSLFAVAGLTAALAVNLAACGGDTDSGGSESLEVIMLSAPPGDDFYYTIERTAQEEADRVGVDLEIQQIPKWDAAEQVPILNAAVAKRPDVILVNPVDRNSLQAPLEAAAQRGIKIITYDTTIRDPGVVETYVSSDIVALGRTAAETQLGLIGNEGTVFYQGTQPNQAFFESMQQGWMDVMNQEPGINQLPVVYSDWEPAKASSQMEATLTANPDLAGGFAGVFSDQQGIVAAVERAGRTDELQLVGLDGAPENVQRLRDGALSAIVSVKAADYGTAVIQAALNSADGEDQPAETVLDQCVLTVETLDDPANAGCLYDNAPEEH
jgi:ribose transport system substrate-binding protein